MSNLAGKRMPTGRRHRRSAARLALIAAFLFGCATPPPLPATTHQVGLGNVAMIAVIQPPQLRLEGFARSKGSGAAQGAGQAFGACLQGMTQGSCSGSMCGAAVILLPVVCGIFAAVGGVAGAIAAPDAAAVAAADARVTATLQARAIQEGLRDQVLAAAARHGTPATVAVSHNAMDGAAPDYRPLAAAGIDTVLETRLSEAGTAGAGINAPVTATMTARVRLVRTADNGAIFAADYTWLGERLKFAEWSAGRGERLLENLSRGMAALGAHIHDSVFLLYAPPAAGFGATGLAPISPPTRGVLTGTPILGDIFEWTVADSRRPTLRWESFPRPADRAAAAEEMARVGKVRYELVVARERNLVPAEIVYRRDGLTASSHTLDIGLPPDSRYFWTVRARFELDGRERVTPWGGAEPPAASGRLVAPNDRSYRFRTPQ